MAYLSSMSSRTVTVVRLQNKRVLGKGRIIDKDGYIHVLYKGHHRTNSLGYVLEHILVFEETNKCCILKCGVVHHRDRNRQNNVWYNLQGMTQRQHMSLHHKDIKIPPWTEEQRQKMSQSCKGRTPWNKGKPWSEETMKKLSESHKGQTPWNKGKHGVQGYTKERAEKISRANKGMIPWNKGKKLG